MDLTNQTTTGWQKFMSFVGNIAAARSAKAIGKYNESVAYQEAQYLRKIAAVEEKVDRVLEEIDYIADAQTTWWEVTDALFMSGFLLVDVQELRHALRLFGDVASICSAKAFEFLFC